MSKTLPELYIAVDVEADGPIPGPFSMISLGMSVVNQPVHRFYSEIKPISENFVAEALAVSGLDRDKLLKEAGCGSMITIDGWIPSIHLI